MMSHCSRSLAILISLSIVLVACNPFLPNPTQIIPRETKTVENTSDVSPTSSTVEEIPQAESWLQATLTLRSVMIELEPTYSDDRSKPVLIQVDTSGNIHLSMPLSIPDDTVAVSDFTAPPDFELFIIDGTAYTRIGADIPLTPDDSYLSMVEDLLFGPEGPGLWLALIPVDGFTAAGSETFGGFSTTKYAVDGPVNVFYVTGTIWVDEESSALVGADLLIPEGLFFPAGSGLSGDVRISFLVEKMDISPITTP
jgi:hypothetical protein